MFPDCISEVCGEHVEEADSHEWNGLETKVENLAEGEADVGAVQSDQVGGEGESAAQTGQAEGISVRKHSVQGVEQVATVQHVHADGNRGMEGNTVKPHIELTRETNLKEWELMEKYILQWSID